MRFRAIIVSLLLLPLLNFAEGTKQLKPDSTYVCALWIINGGGPGYSCFASDQCGPDQRLYVHIAHPGEKIFMGFNADLGSVTFKIKLNGNFQTIKTVTMSNGAPGYIKYHSQAVAGPININPHGYPPVTYSPGIPGDYSIDFIVPSPVDVVEMHMIDITVIDTTITPYVPIDGRLWSKDWGFNTKGLGPQNAFIATQYILTDDSIVTSVNYNHMHGWNFDVTSTRNGCYPWPFPWDSSCMSRHGNHHYPQYKIFLNNPDSTEFPTGSLGEILGDTVSVIPQCNGSYSFIFAVNKPGTIKLNIESDLAPGIQAQDLTINHSVHLGSNSIDWNGFNALGEKVPCGDSIAVTLNYINGLTNIALYDVEKNLGGFIIEPVRPPGAPVASYWNDTILASEGGQTQLSGCYATPPDLGCHIWTGGVGYGIGSQNTVNTWWYAASSQIDLGRFRVQCIPEVPIGISGPVSLCSSSTATYTVDPNPLPGSEPLGYQWVLTDVSSGTIVLDSINTGPSISLHFSDYPTGQKKLKVRAINNLCGYGPYGPGTGGTGISINVLLAPYITNTQTTYALCSGDTTDILLQASLPGSTYTYTVSSTSPLITGQSAGSQNPIRQPLYNTGNTIDSVIYYVVPYISPCPGDTVKFYIRVNPSGNPTIPITASTNPVCEGSPVTITVPDFGGAPAIYTWEVNHIAAGSGSNTFNYTPVDGDTVQCIISSPEFCVTGNTIYSPEMRINVISKVPVIVSLNPSLNPFCTGEPVTITAFPQNEGSSPNYQWLVNGVSSSPSVPAFTYYPANGDEVLCVMTSNYFCVINPVAMDSVTLIQKDDEKFIDTTVCYGVPYYAAGAWQTTEGTYYDTLSPPVDCIRHIETKLSFKPPVPVALGRDTVICGDQVILDATVPGATYLWQDGSSDAVFIVSAPGEYYVDVTLDGCMKADTVKVSECPVNLFFPNAFTPNGDGLNDTFQPKGTGVENFSMQVFDRWGAMIFETNSIEKCWNGTCGGSPCPEGTYVYTATYGSSSGNVKKAKGTVLLQR